MSEQKIVLVTADKRFEIPVSKLRDGAEIVLPQGYEIAYEINPIAMLHDDPLKAFPDTGKVVKITAETD
jgi:hypothetical protein